MKITFIEPSPPGLHIYTFIKQLRLGLPLMATMLRDLGHDVRVYVEVLGDVDWERVMSSDLVGISTITSTAIKAYRYAQRVRQAGIPTLMGGPHVTFETDEALEYCDYVLRGEADDSILEFVEMMENGGDPSGILGLSYHDADGEHVHTESRPLRSGITDLPIPDLSLVDEYQKISPSPLIGSRGCPHDCEFCSVVMMFGRRIRRDTIERTIQALGPMAGKEVFFYDDNFIMSKRFTKELLAQMIRARLDVRFSAQIRVDSVCRNGKVDHELLQLLRDAGCFLVYLGLESADPCTLEEFNKNLNVDDIAGGLQALHSYGINSHGMFVVGADTDTVESIQATVDFAIEHDIGSAQFLILTPLPGTRQTEQLRREGRILTRNWTLYDAMHVVFWPKNMTPYELMQSMIEAHRRFYHPGRFKGNPKHRTMGFLITNAWLRLPENQAYLKELRSYTSPPA